jgi:hypothetical protein
MLQFTLEVDVSQLAKLAKKIDGTSERIRRRLFDVLETDLNLARADMIQTYLSGSATTPTSLARRSGNLMNSWRVIMKESAQGFEGRLFQDQRFKSATYGPVHEFGATITARRVRNLAIPLTEEARQAGTPRKFRDLFVIRSKRGNILLVRRFGTQIEPMYKLQPSVTIPPRPFLRPTSAKYFPIILQDFRREIAAMAQEFSQ